MIAPLRSYETTTVSQRNLREARRAVAAALLRQRCEAEPQVVPAPAGWRIWLYVVWAVAVAVGYLASLIAS